MTESISNLSRNIPGLSLLSVFLVFVLLFVLKLTWHNHVIYFSRQDSGFFGTITPSIADDPFGAPGVHPQVRHDWALLPATVPLSKVRLEPVWAETGQEGHPNQPNASKEKMDPFWTGLFAACGRPPVRSPSRAVALAAT